MSGTRVHRNGSTVLQLPPLPPLPRKAKLWGMPPPSPLQQVQMIIKEWSTRFCRFVSNKRTGLYVAALLACISLLMLVSDFSILSFPRPPLQDGEKRNLEKEIFHSQIGVKFGNDGNVTEAGPKKNSTSPVMLLRPMPPTSFLDPSLPPGHPCQTFSLPPPPADKKRTGPRPCPVCYLPLEDAVKEYPPPGVFPSLILKELRYVHEAVPAVATAGAGSDFGGYPTLEDRRSSYEIKESMHIHCGFAKGSRPGVGSGFDIDETDLADMVKCRGIVVVSAIFGNYDPIQQPKNISDHSKQHVCFFMFVDETTEAAIERSEAYLNRRKVGLWRIATVRNIPYSDPRRTGKIPKLLSHRLFPSARFSLWVDGKLELRVDPYQILERFLWRSKDTFAISKHYKRFDVFLEAEANKAAGKYNNASIDAQVEFYRKEGLVPYTTAKLPIISDVPEGCVIIREHTPITNLFTCLWFNEVDRFTSRDQISFGMVRDKIMAQVPWRINMFLDCERRNFVVQGYHWDVLLQRATSRRLLPPPQRLEAGALSTNPTLHKLSQPLKNSRKPRGRKEVRGQIRVSLY